MGICTTKNGEPLIYRVEHSFWNVYPITEFKHDFDFSKIYGQEWEFLNSQKPYSVTFAKGSAVKVFSAERI